MSETDTITTCVGCDETVDALYCSHSCMMEDDGKVLESPLTDTLYYVTKYEHKGEGKYISKEKREIVFPDDTTDTNN